jgi:hypothetical protein
VNLAKLRDLLWARRAGPELQSGERIAKEGRAILKGGLVGMRTGPLLLTNRRLIWYEGAVARPLKPLYRELALSEVRVVDKGTLLDSIGGGRPVRLRLASGKARCVRLARGSLDEWVADLREAVVTAKGSP